jgi:hypothetical protein
MDLRGIPVVGEDQVGGTRGNESNQERNEPSSMEQGGHGVPFVHSSSVDPARAASPAGAVGYGIVS